MDIFDPAVFSLEENRFLHDTVGKPPVVALSALPPGVNPAAVRPLLSRVYELIELEKHDPSKSWVGIEIIKTQIKRFLTKMQEWEQGYKRGKNPRFPSLYSYDAKHRPHRAGPGSDTGQVRTYIDDTGERKPFAVDLVVPAITDLPPEAIGLMVTEDLGDDHLKINSDLSRIECFCGHTERFSPDSRQSFVMARGRMKKHLIVAKDEVETHREIHTNAFGA